MRPAALSSSTPRTPTSIRYIWEGAVQWHGVNPYSVAPDDPALAGLAQGELAGVWQQVNHKGMTAIYPPASLLFCGAIAAISPTPLVFKAAFTLLDLGVMAVLVAVLRLRGLPPARLLFYAANPLVIVFVCGEGHLDVLQVFFLVCACWALLAGRCALAGLALGLGAMAKYLALAAAPFFWGGCRRLKFAAVLLPALLFVPYVGAGCGLFASLGRFAADMQYNALLADWLGRAWPTVLGACGSIRSAALLALDLADRGRPAARGLPRPRVPAPAAADPAPLVPGVDRPLSVPVSVEGMALSAGGHAVHVPGHGGRVPDRDLPGDPLASSGRNTCRFSRLRRWGFSARTVWPSMPPCPTAVEPVGRHPDPERGRDTSGAAWTRCGSAAGCGRSSWPTAARPTERPQSPGKRVRSSSRPGRAGGSSSGRVRRRRPGTSCSSCTRTRCSQAGAGERIIRSLARRPGGGGRMSRDAVRGRAAGSRAASRR